MINSLNYVVKAKLGTASTEDTATISVASLPFSAQGLKLADAELIAARAADGTLIALAGATCAVSADGASVVVGEYTAGFTTGDELTLLLSFTPAAPLAVVLS